MLGDARLTMAKEKNESFDLIIVDAFSSDAVPVHLMTAEAIRLYLDKVNGERHRAAAHLQPLSRSQLGAGRHHQESCPAPMACIISDDTADGSYAQSTSTVALFAKSEEALEPFRKLETVYEFDADGLKPWTDDYSDILGPFLSKRGYKRGAAE